MTTPKLTRAAAEDLVRLIEWGAQQFGIDVAESYSALLVDHLDEIGRSPQRYPRVDWIRAGYRRSVWKSHSIYFRQSDDDVLIVRILGRQEPGSALP